MTEPTKAWVLTGLNTINKKTTRVYLRVEGGMNEWSMSLDLVETWPTKRHAEMGKSCKAPFYFVPDPDTVEAVEVTIYPPEPRRIIFPESWRRRF